MEIIEYFVNTITAIVGLRLSRNDPESQLIVDYLLAASVLLVWLFALWLSIERAGQEMGNGRIVGMTICSVGVSYGIYLVYLVMIRSPATVGSQVITIMVGALAWLFFRGTLEAGYYRVATAFARLLYRPTLHVHQLLPVVVSSTDYIIPNSYELPYRIFVQPSSSWTFIVPPITRSIEIMHIPPSSSLIPILIPTFSETTSSPSSTSSIIVPPSNSSHIRIVIPPSTLPTLITSSNASTHIPPSHSPSNIIIPPFPSLTPSSYQSMTPDYGPSNGRPPRPPSSPSRSYSDPTMRRRP